MPKRLNQFAHPAPDEFDYETLLETMRVCREQVQAFANACGLRNPARREADALIEQIDAVARLSRIGEAERIVRPSLVGHGTR